MRKGLIGAFQLGTLNGMSDVLAMAGKVSGKAPPDLTGIFYASAFQAGIDNFVLPALHEPIQPSSEFLRTRTSALNQEKSNQNYKLVEGALSHFLPQGWNRNEEYSGVWSLQAFLVDLLDAMESGATLLAVSGVPDIGDIDSLLPSELLAPTANLLASFQRIEATEIAARTQLDREHLERYRELLSSDLFARFVRAQARFEDATQDIVVATGATLETARAVVRPNTAVLSIRRGAAGVLAITPKIVDAVFGKLPGALAEATAKLGSNYLDNRRRIVVYNFEEVTHRFVMSGLQQMLAGSIPEDPFRTGG